MPRSSWKQGAVQGADRDRPDRIGEAQQASGLTADGPAEPPEATGSVAVRSAAQPATLASTALAVPRQGRWRRLADSHVARHLLVLACYLAAGVAVTWPQATWLVEGKL